MNADGTRRCGQPEFAPAALLKLYMAGYLDRVHSSRRLARECRRNLEFMWLLEGLTPGYRTITAFRQFNGPALRAVCKDFILLCKDLDLLGGEEIGIDGSFCNASASDASVITKTTLENIAEEIEDVGKSERRELKSRMAVPLAHLLKWQFQPERRGNRVAP